MSWFERAAGRSASKSTESHLTGWWAEAFTSEEQATIVAQFEKYPPLGTTYDPAHLGEDARFLRNASSWFTRKDMSHIRIRLLDRSLALTGEHGPVLDRHFAYLGLLEAWYKLRDDDSKALSTAMDFCRRMIAIAPQAMTALKADDTWPVTNPGYVQLAVICDKQGRWQEAIDLCAEARSGGWGGDWDARIARYRKKLEKASAPGSARV